MSRGNERLKVLKTQLVRPASKQQPYYHVRKVNSQQQQNDGTGKYYLTLPATVGK